MAIGCVGLGGVGSAGNCGFWVGFCLGGVGEAAVQEALFSFLLRSSWAAFADELAIYLGLAIGCSLFFGSQLALDVFPSLLPSLA